MHEFENFRLEKSAIKPDKALPEFTDSFAFDQKLFEADIRVSIAYCDALFDAGVLTRTEAERIKNGLQAILKRSEYDKNYFNESPVENVHSFVEAKLIQLIGDAGRKLQIGSSRCDQAVTAFRLWLREEIEKISILARQLQAAFINAAERQREAILPGYAHLQRAQPILWAHWCLAYFEMLARDRERLDEVWRRVNVLPLGSANAAGTNFEIDREEVAGNLGFEGVSLNSVDAVSDRDFAVEFVGACALLMVHLSRLAEDLILYASKEFQFIELGGADATVSNLSSRKNNIDRLEIVRGKAGRIFGHQIALLTTHKRLPMAYSKDLQEDNEAVFDTVDTVKICLQTAADVLNGMRVREEKTRAAAAEGYFNAGELADYLVQKDVPVQIADQTVQSILSYAVSKGKQLNELSLAEMQNFSAQIENDIYSVLSLEQTLANKSQIGGTAPERVYEALEAALISLEMEE
jgi:argininosuccinate lyase